MKFIGLFYNWFCTCIYKHRRLELKEKKIHLLNLIVEEMEARGHVKEEAEPKPGSLSTTLCSEWIYAYVSTHNMCGFQVHEHRSLNRSSLTFLCMILTFSSSESQITKNFVDRSTLILYYKRNETLLCRCKFFSLCKFEIFSHPFSEHLFNIIHMPGM